MILILLGKYLVSGQFADDADIFIWDFETQSIVHKLCQHEHGISTMAFTQDGRLLVTVGDFFDRQIYVWNMSDGGIVANVQILANGEASIHTPESESRPPPQPSRSTTAKMVGASSSSGMSGEGQIVAVAWGGRARDIKRRETSDFIFATAGPAVFLWTLTPATGDLKQDIVFLSLF
jgi:WD40 repeat protein